MRIDTDNRRASLNHLDRKPSKRGLPRSEDKRRKARKYINEIENVPEHLHRDTMFWLGATGLIFACLGMGVRLILG